MSLFKFSLEHSKVRKIVLSCTIFVQSILCLSWKISEELCVMTLKGNAKLKRKLTCGLKNDIRNLVNFHASSHKSENFQFLGFLLSKAYKFFDEKIQKSYVSWHWRVIQSLKRKLILGPKNDMKNLVNFNASSEL